MKLHPRFPRPHAVLRRRSAEESERSIRGREGALHALQNDARGANVLLMDEPTNHLDLESITALNNGLIDFDGTLIFISHDHQFIQTIANRIIEITPNGIIDRMMPYDEYLESAEVKEFRERMYPVE